jgi:uncharacterized FlaG/YvyC family protein
MIPSIADVSGRAPQVVAGTVPPARDRRAVAQAVAQLNGSELLGTDQELAVSVDPGTRQLVIRVLDRQTKEVLHQFPSEQLLRVAAALSAYGQNNPGAVGGLSTYA